MSLPETVDPTRYVVLLSCGHWTQTTSPADGVWACPTGEHGPAVLPARDAFNGDVAVLHVWEYWKTI